MSPVSVLLLALTGHVASQQWNAGYNTTGFGEYRIENNTPQNLIDAVDKPIAESSVPFVGFNVSKNLTYSFSGTLTSVHNWTFGVEYSAANVSSSTDGEQNVKVFQYSMSFADENFPEDRYPLDSSDWQICATIFDQGFVSKVQDAQGNPSSSDCGPYIGQACAEAYIQAFNAQSTRSGNCRTPPSFSEIDACGDVFAPNGGGSGTSVISNSTLSGLVYYPTNNSYLDPQTGRSYFLSYLPAEGLKSGSVFGYRQVVLPAGSSSAMNDAAQLQMIAMTISPNTNNVDVGGTGYGPQTRLLCARASNSEVNSGDGDSGSSSAASFSIPTIALLLASVAISVALM